MERKSTQRIIGVLVVLALVIILLPLLFGKNEMLTQAAVIKAPPFPDQQQTVENTTNTTEPVVQDGVQISSSMAAQMNGDTVEIPVDVAAPSPPVSTNPEIAAAANVAPAVTPPTMPEESVNTTAKPVVIENDKNTVVLGATASSNEVSIPKTDNVIEEKVADVAQVMEPKPVVKHPKKSPAKTHAMSHSISPATLKKGWVVQMGSFKVKENATRLADKLRAAGYKAFTREGKSSTRVYVGPEAKQASAVNLSNQIQQRMNIQGVIVSFKPLEL